jgi:hypothetical protein
VPGGLLGEAVSYCPERCPGELDALVEQMVARGRSAEAIDFLRRVVAANPAAERAKMHLDRLAGGPAPSR